jgi:dolichol kinase
LLIAAISFAGLFGIVEYISKHTALSHESSRKLVHILAGIMAACLPIFLSFHQIIYLTSLFVPLLLISKRANLLTSMHQVSRVTYGEVYFPFAILLVALFFPDIPEYEYAVLIMALSDGLASVLGQSFGKRSYVIWASRKTYIGSLVFFIVSCLIGAVIVGCLNLASAQVILISSLLAFILTVVEASLAFGLDNLLLPPLAALLFWSLE